MNAPGHAHDDRAYDDQANRDAAHDDHAHHDHPVAASRSAGAARAQREAAVIGWIDGVPVGREALDERIRRLRQGAMAGRLPAVGGKEDRQFVRWTAQVLLTERLCRVECRRRGLAVPSADPPPLGQLEALHLGSINAAAWSECPGMAALFAAVTTRPCRRDAPAPPVRQWWRVAHALAPDDATARARTLRPLGWTTLDDIPAPVADALRHSPLGVRVGPVRSSLGWHVAVATETATRSLGFPARGDGASGPDGERLREFARWLDQRRRSVLRSAEGFEHPGDPSQPDNTHRH